MSASHADGEHGHGSPFIQHHYDDAQHQFDSGKLGIWVFLAQEILFFSALFVAYIVYRANHPEIFAYAHKYLDTNMGAINTGVLIVSSLTAAWAVRAAQLRQHKLLIGLIIITIACACGFLGIKYVEYSHKIHIGTLYGEKFHPTEAPNGESLVKKNEKGEEFVPPARNSKTAPELPTPTPPPVMEVTTTKEAPQKRPTTGALKAAVQKEEGGHGTAAAGPPPANTAMFFTIYFAMTGLHGIHVLIGILIWIWLLIRAIKRHFTPDYFGPIDYTALYWHLVDLIWIYLFPLLYLIH